MGMMATHEIIRMANALGIDIDYSTLRFWQKRGLIPKPVRGALHHGRGTRGYYDMSLVERIGFIREVQKTYLMGLDAIRQELDCIDRKNAESGSADVAKPFRDRLEELQARRDVETRRALMVVIARAVGLQADDIASVVIRKKDGQVIRVPAEE